MMTTANRNWELRYDELFEERVKAHPWTKDGPVHGLIFEIETGRLREVS